MVEGTTSVVDTRACDPVVVVVVDCGDTEKRTSSNTSSSCILAVWYNKLLRERFWNRGTDGCCLEYFTVEKVTKVGDVIDGGHILDLVLVSWNPETSCCCNVNRHTAVERIDVAWDRNRAVVIVSEYMVVGVAWKQKKSSRISKMNLWENDSAEKCKIITASKRKSGYYILLGRKICF